MVENLPHDVAEGVDAQLERAVDVLLELAAEHPPVEPAFDPEPLKSRGAYASELAEETGD